MAKIKVVIFDGNTLKHQEISNTLKSLQGIVGGNIECPYLGTELDAVGITSTINEEGKLLDLPWVLGVMYEGELADVVCGKIIFSRIDIEGNMSSLYPGDYDLIKREIKRSNFIVRKTGKPLYIIEAL